MQLPHVVLAAIAFTSTNIDDIFLLLAFFSDHRLTARIVIAGQFLGIGVLTAVSAICALIALAFPPEYVGLLGLVPVGIGISRLRRGDDEDGPPDIGASAHRLWAVASVTIANGGDNIGVYTPMFAGQSSSELATTVIVFAGMTALWCVVAYRLVNHRSLGAPIRRWGHRLLPFVLIALGVHILFEAGTVELFRRR